MFITKLICRECQKNVPTSWLSKVLRLDYHVGAQLRAVHSERAHIPVPMRPVKGKSEKVYATKFEDWRQIKVIGGKGGDGRISLLSVYMIEFAGPDGGDGGHGGHVLLTADPKVKDFSHLSPVINASRGVPGGSDNMHGKDAQHRILKVPLGTMIKNMEDEVICDLAKEGSMFLAAKGGAGGKGNASFKNSVEQAPKVAEVGAEGEAYIYNLELRTMADVGLIGFPNAGKSTLLQAISRARPKVASYPFTTVNPHIGMVPYDDLTSLAVADLPGLIRGSSENKGLGYAFLQHVQRCRLLLFVIDLSADDPLDQLDALKHELEAYKPGLSSKPAAIVANKIDLQYSQHHIDQLQKTGLEVILTSGRTGKGLEQLLIRAKQMSDEFDSSTEE